MIPLTFQLQSYYEYGGEREYSDPQFGNGSITFYNYPEADDVQITVQPFGRQVSEGGSEEITQEAVFSFMRANNVSNLFSLTMNSTSYQLTTFPINFTATPDFTNGVVAFSNTYNIAPFDFSIGSLNVTWRDLCEQVIQGSYPTIRLAGNWSSSTNTDTVQILEGRVLNRSRAGQGGGAIDLTTLISFSPEGVNNMPNTYNMDCLATLRLHQNYALETISTKMVGSGGGSAPLILTVTPDQQTEGNFTWTGATIEEIRTAFNNGTEVLIRVSIDSVNVYRVTAVRYTSTVAELSVTTDAIHTLALRLYPNGQGESLEITLIYSETLNAALSTKQNTLTAGDGISITDGVISCTFANGNGISY